MKKLYKITFGNKEDGLFFVYPIYCHKSQLIKEIINARNAFENKCGLGELNLSTLNIELLK